MSTQLPSLPEPVEQTQPQAAPDIEIVREDDTPEQDRGKPAPAPETYTAVDDERQDASYGDQVQGRIKQLRHVYHEERRQKEAAQREREALVGYAQSLQGEVEKLRTLVSSGEKVLLDQASLRAEAQVANAREMWRRAHDSGDADELIKAQEQLARAVADHEKMKSLRPSIPEQAPQQRVPQQQFQPPAPQQPPVKDERYEAWKAQHQWHRQPGYEEATQYLDFIHQQLLQNGVYPQGATADAYWSTVNQRLVNTFPQLAGSSQGNVQQQNGNGQPPQSPQTRSRPVTATSGNRSSNTPQKVRLKESQIRMAERLGVTPEQYAREVLRIERQNGQR
jgi:hypothetical protein